MTGPRPVDVTDVDHAQGLDRCSGCSGPVVFVEQLPGTFSIVSRALLRCSTCGVQYVRTTTRRRARTAELVDVRPVSAGGSSFYDEHLAAVARVAADNPDLEHGALADLVRRALRVSRSHAYRMLRDARLRGLIPKGPNP